MHAEEYPRERTLKVWRCFVVSFHKADGKSTTHIACGYVVLSNFCLIGAEVQNTKDVLVG